jgi:hypothetical protein
LTSVPHKLEALVAVARNLAAAFRVGWDAKSGMKTHGMPVYFGTTIHGTSWNRSESVWRSGMHIAFVFG